MATSDRRVGVTLALCFLAAVTEGMDLQSMGVAASMVSAEYGLDPKTLGHVLMASPVGLLAGAIFGGRLADAVGRKMVLVLSLTIFGLFTLGTTLVKGTEALLVMRFLTGLGLGGAMPNLLALTSEALAGKGKVSQIVLTFAGMPIGGMVISYVAKWATDIDDWRMIFYVGGIAPLVLAPVMLAVLPESRKFQEERDLVRAGTKTRPDSLKVLLGEGRAPATLCLWVCCLLLNVVSYLLLSWLPVLNKAKGFGPGDVAALQIVFNLASFAGSFALGLLMDARPGKLVLGGCFVGLAAGLVGLAATGSDVMVAGALIGVVGAALYGGLFIVYGLTPNYYPVLVRGVAAGAVFAAGRIGAIAGPWLAGALLGGGRGAGEVLQALLPVTAVAGAAAMVLLFLPARAERAEAEAAPAE
jgi:MFS transporter, AAHS family, 3-hydroxyphenylpropionic acid transporter